MVVRSVIVTFFTRDIDKVNDGLSVRQNFRYVAVTLVFLSLYKESALLCMRKGYELSSQRMRKIFLSLEGNIQMLAVIYGS